MLVLKPFLTSGIILHHPKIESTYFMRLTAILFFLSLLGINSSAQTTKCESPYLHVGAQIHYIFQQPDESAYQDESFFSKPYSKQKEISEHHLKDHPWYADMRSIKIRNVTKDSTGFVYYEVTAKEHKKPKEEKEFLMRCKDGIIENLSYSKKTSANNDTLHFVNQILGIEILLGDSTHPSNGFSANFPIGYPNQMIKGQRLPDYLMSFSIHQNNSNAVKFNYKLFNKSVLKMKTGSGIDFLNNLLKATQETYGFKLVDDYIHQSAVTENWLMNRQITAAKTITLNGKTYETFLIKEEIWSYTGQCSIQSANDWLMKFNNRFESESNKAKSELWRQKHQPNTQGYMVETLETWYIPGLGAYEMKRYNSYGVNNYILELKGLK
jgi:hypothetical protein